MEISFTNGNTKVLVHGELLSDNGSEFWLNDNSSLGSLNDKSIESVLANENFVKVADEEAGWRTEYVYKTAEGLELEAGGLCYSEFSQLPEQARKTNVEFAENTNSVKTWIGCEIIHANQGFMWVRTSDNINQVLQISNHVFRHVAVEDS